MKYFPGPDLICKVDRKERERDLSTHRRARLGPLFKLTSVDGQSVEDPRNFPKAHGITTCIRDSGRNLKVWYFLEECKDVFPDIRVFETGTPELKKLSHFCAESVPVVLHPSVYRAAKLTFPMDVGRIVPGGRMTTELGTGSLGHSVGVLSPADFRPICE